MIASFRHAGLWELFQTSATYDVCDVNDKISDQVLRRLEALNLAERPEDLDLPGFRLRVVAGASPARYAFLVGDDGLLTFGFERGAATDVDWERRV